MKISNKTKAKTKTSLSSKSKSVKQKPKLDVCLTCQEYDDNPPEDLKVPFGKGLCVLKSWVIEKSLAASQAVCENWGGKENVDIESEEKSRKL